MIVVIANLLKSHFHLLSFNHSSNSHSRTSLYGIVVFYENISDKHEKSSKLE